MIEDMDYYNGSNGIYKQQPPLRPPPMPSMNVPPSIRASVSPRFENIMTRSSSVPWSPAPLDGNHYGKPSADPLATGHTYTKSPEMWTNSNPYTKSTEAWMINNAPNKSTDSWLNTNAQSKSTEPWSPTNAFSKPVDSTIISNNSSNAQMIKSSDKKTCGFITDRCSPRCKLGILGFIIGFLAVGIALAVVLVLWLRK